MRGRDILDAFLAAHEQAVQRTQRHEANLSIAGQTLRLVFAGTALAELNLRAFRHLPTSLQTPELELRIFDSGFSSVPPPLRPWEGLPPLRRFELQTSEPDGTRMTFSARPMALTIWDPARKLAVHWSEAGADYPVLALASPFHFLLCWWAESRGAVVAHSAAVGREGRGILLAGRGGSGKSSTALASLEDGLTYAGDDSIWCELDPAHGGPPVGWPLYSTARVFPQDLERLPKIRAAVIPQGNRDKRVLFLGAHFHAQIQPLQLEALYLPRIDPGADSTRILPATRSSAFRALAPASIEFHPYSGKTTLQRLTRLSSRLPSFHLVLGNDRAPAAHVRSILASLQTPQNIRTA